MPELIKPADLNPLHRKMNETLMVAFINRHSAWHLDVRKSFAYYDSDKDFVLATENELSGPGADAAFEKLDIKYYSKGVK